LEIVGDSLDLLLVGMYRALLDDANKNIGSRGGTLEALGVTLRLSKPRARLSRSEDRGKPFSALGELLWYLTGSDSLDFIRHYVPAYKDEAEEDGTLYGAYGPRLFAMRDGVDQLRSILTLLKERPSSRRAVVQLFNAEDIATHHKEVPCTTAFQFFIRDDRLHMAVTMRSNDAYKGLPHDIFCFTMIQEMLARALEVELGEYMHFVGSMHLYENNIDSAKDYAVEGYQRTVEMPPMPAGDPFAIVKVLKGVEDRLRHGEEVVAGDVVGQDYWADIVRLFQVFWASGQPEVIDELMASFSNYHYKIYAEGRKEMAKRQYAVRSSTEPAEKPA
jgi:thymidylate synthase